MKRIWLLLLLITPLYATEYAPWFSPLWEFQGELSYLYKHVLKVESPKGDFNFRSDDQSIRGSLGLTPWPYWNIEVELFLTETSTIPFSYEAAYGSVRYQWLDDIRGDPIALVTGVTLFFPNKRYQRNFSFPYHGDINVELHATIGKEWACGREWSTRGWILGGWGIANKGNGWLHGLAVMEFNPGFFEWGIFTEILCGLGSNDVISSEQFAGYASIGHRSVDVGGHLKIDLSCIGSLTILGWINSYARNYILHTWGFGINILIPFSL
jgi:hypothetical protein